MAEINYMVGGEAGQGVQTVGALLSKILTRHGLYVFADQDYESRVRGGHSFFRIRASDIPIGSISEKLDVLIGLDAQTIKIHEKEVKKDGLIIYDPEKFTGNINGNSIAIPFEKLAQEHAGNKVMASSVAVGAAVASAGYGLEQVTMPLFVEEFTSKGEPVVEGNKKAVQVGFDEIKKQKVPFLIDKLNANGKKKILIDGNTAFAIGALAAGVKFVAGYPMTPTSPILEYIADKGRQYGVVMIQPEDEIAAVNMAIGAAYAGSRAMTATSGGGFCLMVEGLSLEGMTETPLVVVLGQRPGPAIGLPTRTEQGELLFSIFSGHGEFPRAVFTPPTIEDCFNAAVNAFNIAEKYQALSIILTDQHLGASFQTIQPFDLSKVRIDRGNIINLDGRKVAGEYKRHQFTDTGISPRAVPLPGGPLVVTDSDEHNEEGHIIEDTETRIRMMDKRMGKLKLMRQEILEPWYFEKPGAEIVLVGWGSTYGAISEAADLLEKEDIPVNILQYPQVWPFPAERTASILCKNGMQSFVIENNWTGQLAWLIRAETGVKVNHQIHKYDGRPFSPAMIAESVKKAAKKEVVAKT